MTSKVKSARGLHYPYWVSLTLQRLTKCGQYCSGQIKSGEEKPKPSLCWCSTNYTLPFSAGKFWAQSLCGHCCWLLVGSQLQSNWWHSHAFLTPHHTFWYRKATKRPSWKVGESYLLQPKGEQGWNMLLHLEASQDQQSSALEASRIVNAAGEGGILSYKERKWEGNIKLSCLIPGRETWENYGFPSPCQCSWTEN